MSDGYVVEVEVFGGQIVRRIAFQFYENKMLIVTEEEWKNSLSEDRVTIGIGDDRNKVFFVSE